MVMSDQAHDAWCRLVIGTWIRRWRGQTGVSQRTLAELARVDQGFLSRVERGHRRIAGAPLARLIIALDWLSGGGMPDSPWAAMRQPLPTAPWIAGSPPPVVIGVIPDEPARGTSPAAAWEVAMAAMERDVSNRTSRLQPPTLEELRQRRDAQADAGQPPSTLRRPMPGES